MDKVNEIEFGKEDGDEYLSHSVWGDEEEIDGVVEKEFYFNNDKIVIKNKQTTGINNSYKDSFDDDINLTCRLGDLRLGLIQQYLYDVKSDLYEEVLKLSLDELGKKLDVIDYSSETLKVKNIGVLMFTEKPKEFIPQSYIELTHFENSSADQYIEKIFDGPIHEQIRGVLRYVKDNLIKMKKIGSKEVFNYPLKAIKEAVTNAVYHKDYKVGIPIEIRIYKTEFLIISYPGADKFIDKEEINNGEVRARIYRNLRIGEFLKNLHISSSKSSGLGKIFKEMSLNNSNIPVFKMDDERTYFSISFNINEEFLDEKQVVSNKKQKYEEDLNLTEKKILELLKGGPLSKKEIVNAFGHKNVTRDIKIALDSLSIKKYIEFTIKSRASSRNQKYKLIV